MTSRYLKRVYSGAVLEMEIYIASDGNAPKPGIDRKTVRTEEEKQEYNRRKSEKHFIRIVNTNFSSSDYYVTATYNNERLPASYEAAANNLDNYVRRLRRNNPNAKIIAVTGCGRKSGRLHHHLIISGVSESDIISKWNGGEIVRAEHLRAHNYYSGVDHGEDFTALSVYLHAHTPTDVKGRRWKQTKSIQQPKEEKPKKIKRVYSESKPPKAPQGFEFVEVYTSEYFGGGYMRFKYVRITNTAAEININRYTKYTQRAKKSAVLNC